MIFSKVRDDEVREVRELINQSYRQQELQTFSENIIFPFKVSRISILRMHLKQIKDFPLWMILTRPDTS